MALLKDPNLRRFWFPVPGHLGIGVTAYSRTEAETLARAAANQVGWPFDGSAVVEDIDVRDSEK